MSCNECCSKKPMACMYLIGDVSSSQKKRFRDISGTVTSRFTVMSIFICP